MLNIEGTNNNSSPDSSMPLFRLGFRPFFLAAALFAIISMIIWMASYIFSVDFYFSGLSPSIWHAHEMIFGYAMAVIAGFLLTAIKNWTGVEVLRGKPLASLLMLWVVARILALSGSMFSVELIAVIDVLFLLVVTLICLRPVIIARQFKHMTIISILFLLMLCDLVFYLGVTGIIENGVSWGLYSAIYLLITLVLLMMRRVMPMFITNGVDGDVEMTNRVWLDYAALLLLLCLWIADVFTSYATLTAVVAAVLSVLHMVRLSGWYSHKIWSKPLVWVLVIAYASFIFGFALKALSFISDVPPFLSVHAFTVGGIGMITIGMMSRVSLGHTGRNVFDPPPVVFWIISVMFLGVISRVVLPLFNIGLYNYWIGLSQVLWVIAFSLFLFVYAPMLVSSRADGRDG